MRAVWSRARPARWHTIFFLRIAAGTVMVLVTMFVSWRIQREFVFSRAASERWSERIGRLKNVSRMAMEFVLPGKNACAFGDVLNERTPACVVSEASVLSEAAYWLEGFKASHHEPLGLTLEPIGFQAAGAPGRGSNG